MIRSLLIACDHKQDWLRSSDSAAQWRCIKWYCRRRDAYIGLL